MISDFIPTFIDHWHIIVLFFMVAIVYSSVGFGGGSSYLAILSFTALAFSEIRFIALLCNIVVVSSSVYLHFKNRFYNWKKVLPLVFLSVPMAFLGGYLKIEETFFFILLASTLLLAAASMLLSHKKIKPISNKLQSSIKSASYGGVIGFLSGMVGIGGGIFLAPLLHLTHWDSTKRIVATSSLFILLNSISGLFGQFYNEDFNSDISLTIILALTVLIGGLIGSRLSVYKFSSSVIKRITAILILIVAVRLLVKYLF